MYGLFKKLFDGDVFNSTQIAKLAATTMDTSLAGIGRVREGIGSFRRTRVLLGIEDTSKPAGTVKNYPVMAVNAGSSLGYAGQALFTFPQGVIEIFGVCPNLALTTTASWAPTTPVMSIGTVTAGNDATLTGTEANVVASTALTISGGAATFAPKANAAPISALTAATGTASTTINDVTGSFSQSVLNNNFKSIATQLNAIINEMAGVPPMVFDGTSAAIELFLNFACNSAVSSDTITLSGTIDVLWAPLTLVTPP